MQNTSMRRLNDNKTTKNRVHVAIISYNLTVALPVLSTIVPVKLFARSLTSIPPRGA
jgi:hypothetical protein